MIHYWYRLLALFGLTTIREHRRTIDGYREERIYREERVSDLENRITRGIQVLSDQERGTLRGGSGVVIGHPPYRDE